LAEKLKPFGYSVSYNPEFIAQGSIIRDQLQPDQVLIGEANEEVGNRLQGIYENLVSNTPTYCRMDSQSAEIAKLATNCFLTTKISFANSIGDLATSVGADAEKILAAVGADSRIGEKYLKHGFGFGGPCFPRDNRALGKYAEAKGYPLIISNATDKVNETHFEFQLQQYLKDSEAGTAVLFDGVAYKKGTSQLTESQQLRLAVALAKKGRTVIIRDSKEVAEQVEKLHPEMFKFESEFSLIGR
ncbi:MAG: UDP-glucose/GDP-mannose dehydrogenase family protein, partial [Flavobacteriales bacterium]|nr:UDP-glucose/GDP-mannose dehydrogenase family protein [Flavobacteriales bacterium]